jgi:hypothetical protein
MFALTPSTRRLAEIVLLGLVPMLASVFTLSAHSNDRRLALDFHNEIYRQADAVVHGPDVRLAVLGFAWRRRSLGLAIAAALVLSPIVWRHFLALLMVPLALSRPRFDAVWLIPIGLWIGDGTLNGAPWQTASVLALVTLTFVLCESRPSRDRQPSLTSMRPAAEV